MKRSYDIILWGASGFTGALVAEYFLREYGLNKTFKWAIAGRNKQKLKALRLKLKSIDHNALKIPILIGDSLDIKTLEPIVKETTVICSTIGPYLEYGKLLIKACVNQRTDYCDITGESPFIRENIEKYYNTAKNERLKIVHCCGYDSIPSDLGCLMIQDFSIKLNNAPCDKVRLYVEETKGGFSGGTIASMLNMMKKSKIDKNMKKIIKDPYAFNILNRWKGNDDLGQRDVRWDSDINKWTGPFIMAMINTKIVRFSNEIMGIKYGKDFSYQEAMTFPRGKLNLIRAKIFRLGLGLFSYIQKLKILGLTFNKLFLPKPGEGPSKIKREGGYFNLTLIGKGINNGKNFKVVGTIYGDKDPGYAGTARMIGEAAICLSKHKEKLPKTFGVLTPASAIGKKLIERLSKKGMEFKVKAENTI